MVVGRGSVPAHPAHDGEGLSMDAITDATAVAAAPESASAAESPTMPDFEAISTGSPLLCGLALYGLPDMATRSQRGAGRTAPRRRLDGCDGRALSLRGLRSARVRQSRRDDHSLADPVAAPREEEEPRDACGRRLQSISCLGPVAATRCGRHRPAPVPCAQAGRFRCCPSVGGCSVELRVPRLAQNPGPSGGGSSAAQPRLIRGTLSASRRHSLKSIATA